jgi:hypothetical protein
MSNLSTIGIEAEAERIEGIIKALPPGKYPSDVLAVEEYIWYRDYILTKWQKAKEALDIAKEFEIKVRTDAVHFAFDPTKQKGTERIELGNGYQAKAVKKINYGWIKDSDDKINKDAIETALNKIEDTGPAGELIAARLVKWTPDLSLTEYNQLPQEFKSIIDEVIVTTEGTPTLEIIEPKAKK